MKRKNGGNKRGRPNRDKKKKIVPKEGGVIPWECTYCKKTFITDEEISNHRKNCDEKQKPVKEAKSAGKAPIT